MSPFQNTKLNLETKPMLNTNWHMTKPATAEALKRFGSNAAVMILPISVICNYHQRMTA